MKTLNQYLATRANHSDFYEQVLAVSESQIVNQKNITIMIDEEKTHWPNRIIFIDQYALAKDIELNGCPCCSFQDYVLHFTTSIETKIGDVKVYLRTIDWATKGSEAKTWHRATTKLKENGAHIDVEKSVARVPELLEFYKKKGVPEVILEKTENKLMDLIKNEERRLSELK
jgi:hypothetical protein